MSFVNSLFLIFRILVSAVYSIPLQGQLAKRCTNSAADRGCWGEYDITTNYYDISPDTGVTKEVCIPQTEKLVPSSLQDSLTHNSRSTGSISQTQRRLLMV